VPHAGCTVMKKSRYVLAGIFAGVLVGGVALVVAWFYAGFGHGTYTPAKILFPYTMYFAVAFAGRITMPSLLLAFLEFPAYGLAAGLAAQRKKAILALGFILVLHVVTMALRLRIENDTFGAIFRTLGEAQAFAARF
jgi:hypothetical protein